jgi:antitoxin component YwqK of YwqJK toxin-antitoxin module
MDKKPKTVIINELVLLCEDEDETCDGVSIAYFKKHHLVNKNNQLAEKDFYYDTIVEGFSYNGKHNPISAMTLVNHQTKNNIDSEKIVIENGYPIGIYIASIYESNAINQTDSVKVITYKNGNISGDFKIINTKDSLLYKTTFKNGRGYWKDYYYEKSKLREEGKVKYNYKVGQWKYYDIFGTIDSIKTYTLKDCVDVRFSFNFFNKDEPYYPIK